MSITSQPDMQQLQRMTADLAGFLVEKFRQQHPADVMDALLSAYINVAYSAGLLGTVPAGAAALISHPSVMASMGHKPDNLPVH